MPLVIRERKNFKYGQIDSLEPQSIPAGAASSALNWLTKGDKIEVRRGYKFLGDTSINTGTGRISGRIKVVDASGIEHLWRSRGKKVEYFDRTTTEWVELDTDILGDDADGEDVTFAVYVTNAGYQLWFNSKNSSLFKVMISNPDDYADMYDSSKNYKGKITIKDNRMWLWGRVKDTTGIYLSYIDSQTYTTVSNENIGTGDGAEKTFTDTLVFKAGGAKRTCFGITVTDSVETFVDNYDGTLTGSLGGTGTINYMTGVISVTFNTAPAGAQGITCDHQWEDSTNGGIADFTESGTRLAGEGAIFRQDEGGGAMQTLLFLGATAFCFHEKKTWALFLTNDDTNATNKIHRESLGIPYHLGAWAVGDGIFVIDEGDQSDPKIRLMTYDTGSSEVIDVPISNNVDLSGYRFDRGAGFEYGDLELIACRKKNDADNNRVLVYNKLWKSFDWLDYYASMFEEYDGVLHACDSITDNVAEIFSGFDDDDSLIPNEWIGNLDDLDMPSMLKKTKRYVLQGEVGPSQIIRAYLSIDNGAFVEITDEDGNEAIRGDGTYIDTGQSINVGANVVGRSEVGGGSDGAVAYNYQRELRLRFDKKELVKVKFVATGIGYASVSMYKFWDVRGKGQRNPQKYRVT